MIEALGHVAEEIVRVLARPNFVCILAEHRKVFWLISSLFCALFASMTAPPSTKAPPGHLNGPAGLIGSGFRALLVAFFNPLKRRAHFPEIPGLSGFWRRIWLSYPKASLEIS